MNKKIGQCYLCGKVGKITKEHVPPKFLSPKSLNGEFAAISACKDCNKGNSHAESKFRDFVAVGSAFTGNKSADDAYKASLRNFQRSPAARMFLGPSVDLIRIVKSIKRVDLISKGGVYLGKAPTLYVPDEPDYNNILIKIAKGVHYLKTGSVIPANYSVFAGFLKEVPLPELEILNSLNPSERAGDFFHFRGGYAKEDINACIYFMVFYKRMLARVWFMPPK